MNDHTPMTRVNSRENLQNPPLDLTKPNSTIFFSSLLGLTDDRSQISPQKLQDQYGVLVLTPEVLVQNDDVWGALEDLEGLDFAEGGLVVVDLFQCYDEPVGEATSPVNVGVGPGSDPF